MNLVVFDVDGTLIQSTGVDDESFARAIEVAWGIPHISTQWGDYAHVTDSGIAAELCQKHFGQDPTPAQMESLQREFLNQLASALQGTVIRQTPGAAKILRILQHNQRWQTAIATGSWSRAIEFKLQSANLSLSSLPMATSDDASDRADVIQIAADRAKELYRQPQWASLVYVGDGIWDFRAARTQGCGFVGIASDKKAEALRREGAKHVLADFADEARFLEAIEAASIILGSGLD